ncbi:hypothetical protein BB558_007029 [Smittium angustum]|uniref:Amino acid permease/ SLC12A domain-containing protein n=1 Tax=Smittium angustum TaxID=133377 RepID=A0A2U1IW56_SMIAN|nr:hypothetical protein BB558_007029 [Smittium angustum]
MSTNVDENINGELDHSERKNLNTNGFPIEDSDESKALEENKLKRSLAGRHMKMIAIGGTIGTGLFVASGQTLSNAGPGGSLASYVVSGLMVYFVMTSLSEMVTYMPVVGSFNSFADRFVDPAFGFALAWMYWFNWVVTTATDMVSAGIIMRFWFPKIGFAVWSLIFMVLIFGVNLMGAREYGEIEFWLALIKIFAVLVFIFTGILVISGAVGGTKYGVSNWNYEGGPFINGFSGIVSVFVVAGFSFQGTEIVGTTSGESKNPTRDIPRAIKSIFWRILLFYILSIAVIGLVIKHDDPNLLGSNIDSVTKSPFVIVFEKAGIKVAGHIMNAVILSSVVSAGNSGLYLTTRTMYALAKEQKAWGFLQTVSVKGVPVYSLLFGSFFICIIFAFSFIGNQSLFSSLVNVSGLVGFIAWLGILFIHFRFRRAYIKQGYSLDDLPYKASLYPYGPAFSFFLLLFVTLGQGYPTFSKGKFTVGDFFVYYAAILVTIVLFAVYKITKKTSLIKIDDIDLDTDSYIHQGFGNYRHIKLEIIDSEINLKNTLAEIYTLLIEKTKVECTKLYNQSKTKQLVNYTTFFFGICLFEKLELEISRLNSLKNSSKKNLAEKHCELIVVLIYIIIKSLKITDKKDELPNDFFVGKEPELVIELLQNCLNGLGSKVEKTTLQTFVKHLNKSEEMGSLNPKECLALCKDPKENFDKIHSVVLDSKIPIVHIQNISNIEQKHVSDSNEKEEWESQTKELCVLAITSVKNKYEKINTENLEKLVYILDRSVLEYLSLSDQKTAIRCLENVSDIEYIFNKYLSSMGLLLENCFEFCKEFIKNYLTGYQHNKILVLIAKDLNSTHFHNQFIELVLLRQKDIEIDTMHIYLTNAEKLCQKFTNRSHAQSHNARLICMLFKQLFSAGNLPISEFKVELLTFCLSYIWAKDAVDLYALVSEGG